MKVSIYSLLVLDRESLAQQYSGPIVEYKEKEILQEQLR